MARDVNLRLYVDDGGWRPAAAGDFVGIKLTGDQVAAGNKEFTDSITFGAGGLISNSTVGTILMNNSSQSNIKLIGPTNSTISFEPSGGGKVSIRAASPGTNTLIYIPTLPNSATASFITNKTSLGFQSIEDTLLLTGPVSITDNFTLQSNTAYFTNMGFLFDTASLNNFASSTSDRLVATTGTQSIAGSKTFTSSTAFESAVSVTGGTFTANDNATFNNSTVSFVGTTFSFDTNSQTSITNELTGAFVTVTDKNQSIDGQKTFSDLVSSQTSLNGTFSATNLAFSFDTNSLDSLSDNASNNFVVTTGEQAIGGFKKFDKLAVNMPVGYSHAGKEFIVSGESYFLDNVDFEGEKVTFGVDKGIWIDNKGSVPDYDFLNFTGNSVLNVSGGLATLSGQIAIVSPTIYNSLSLISGTEVTFWDTEFDFFFADTSTKSNFANAFDNLVNVTGDQTISGLKTFADVIHFNDASNNRQSTIITQDRGVGIFPAYTHVLPLGAGYFALTSQTDGTITSEDISNGDDIVYTTGNQTISGLKTFQNSQIKLTRTSPWPMSLGISGSIAGEAEINSDSIFNIIAGNQLKFICDSIYFSSIPNVSGIDFLLVGDAPQTSEVVYITGDQTISGLKTFSNNVTFGANLDFADTLSTYSSGAEINYNEATLHVNSGTVLEVNNSGSLLLKSSPPATASSAGTSGEIRVGADYLYVATGTNAWGRVQVTGW